MKKERILSLCLASLLILSLAACKGQAEEQDSAPPTASVQPTPEPTPTPTPPPIPYTDVPEDAPYYDAVVWAYQNGIASDGDTFEPDSACTRGQVITFLWRAMGSPEPQITESPVSDISPSDWYYKPVLWAYESGISTSSTFKPNNSCANGEALTFLWRAEGKPMAAVNSSAVALAASGAYYERPAAWADNNGLFAQMGAAFDPSAPCSRAYLMSYLYWAEEQWASAEETRALQVEYEQIIQDAQLYEVHGTGLCYADYVDVDGDGKVELLTVGFDKDLLITAAVYANDNGHAEKYCEGTFKTAYLGKFGGFFVGTANGELYICSAGSTVEGAGAYYDNTYQFFKVGKGTFSLEDDLHDEEEYNLEKEMFEYTYFVSDKEVPENKYNEILKKYPDENSRSICSIDFGNLYISDRGLLPSAEEYYNKWVYPAVLNGDFSFFAGTYKCGYSSIGAESLTLNKDGTLEGGHSRTAINQKPISINVTATGVIQCVIIPIGEIGDFDAGTGKYVGETYDIYPIGVKFNDELYDGYVEAPPSDTGTLRIIYAHWGGTAGPNYSQYYKAP